MDNGGDKRPRPPLVFITDSKRNDNFRRKIRFAELSLNIVGPKLFKLTKDKKNRSDETVDNNYHPARASSDVASSLAPIPGRRPASVVAWSARRGVLRVQPCALDASDLTDSSAYLLVLLFFDCHWN